jgi:hypothetical protein
MADDPLGGIFGPQDDPLHSLFGPPVNPEWTQGPRPDQTQADAEQELKDSAFAKRVAQQRTDDALTLDRNVARRAQREEDSHSIASGIAAAYQSSPADLVSQGVEGTEAGWNSTLAMMRQNRADFEITIHGPTKELIEASDRAKAEADAFNKQSPDTGIANVGYNIANLAASMFSSGKQAVKAAEAGAIVGAASGAAAGAPAGGVGAVPGAIAGGISGGTAGLTAGFIGDSYVTNAGQIMGDLREAGVDRATAKSYGMAGGAIMAGLDLFGIGFAARPFIKAAERRAVQAEIAKELKKRVLSETARDYFMGLAGETGAETAQQIVQDVTTDLAKQSTGGDYKTIFNDPDRRREVVRNAVQTAVAVAEGMTVLGLPGVAVDTIRARREKANGEAMDRGAPLVTPEDQTSPLPTSLIQQGKGQAEIDLDKQTLELVNKYLPDVKPVEGASAPVVDSNRVTVPKGEAHLPSDIVEGLINRGIPQVAARAAAAGTFAEARGDHTAVNPTSGATGLGQWLGARKDELETRYGPNPTREQQLDFLAYELKGGDSGGKAVLEAKDEASALHAYITKFMRPALGRDTENDLKRGLAALGGGEIDTSGIAGDSSAPAQAEEEAASTADQIPMPNVGEESPTGQAQPVDDAQLAEQPQLRDHIEEQAEPSRRADRCAEGGGQLQEGPYQPSRPRHHDRDAEGCQRAGTSPDGKPVVRRHAGPLRLREAHARRRRRAGGRLCRAEAREPARFRHRPARCTTPASSTSTRRCSATDTGRSYRRLSRGLQ